jgi:hypothetical protein
LLNSSTYWKHNFIFCFHPHSFCFSFCPFPFSFISSVSLRYVVAFFCSFSTQISYFLITSQLLFPILFTRYIRFFYVLLEITGTIFHLNFILADSTLKPFTNFCKRTVTDFVGDKMLSNGDCSNVVALLAQSVNFGRLYFWLLVAKFDGRFNWSGSKDHFMFGEKT